MNNKNKVITALALTAGSAAGIAALNKYIKYRATSRSLTALTQSLCFKWRLGTVHYTKSGTGKPVVLIHDLNFASSGYEWNLLIDQLSEHYTVYCLDLLGCGRSEKPNLTYTNYLYVQLITDFIQSEIGVPTNVIATGSSASIAIMSCSTKPELFDQIMLINPDTIYQNSRIPGKRIRLFKLILDTPLIGTLIYNIAASHALIKESFCTRYFYNPYSVKPVVTDFYFESAHLGQCPKAVFASRECCYTNCNIVNALEKIDNSIFIIGGAEEPFINENIAEYKTYNPAIESAIIGKSKHLPQLEEPGKLLSAITMFFSES